MEFLFTWDGINIAEQLTKNIDILFFSTIFKLKMNLNYLDLE